jgi:hypothetical protein
MGVSCRRRAKPTSVGQDLPEGSTPSNRALSGRPVATALGTTAGRTVGGWIPGGNALDTFREVKLRRVNPMSAAGAKQNRHGLGGSKPSRG